MDKQITPFWLVWNPQGFPPKYQHGTEECARAEAERLARAVPGKQFYVLRPIAEMHRTDVTVTNYGNEEDITF